MGKGDSNVPERIRPLKLMNCGLVSGLLQAAVFNPWDRALYLSVKNERVFLHAENFRSPMAGVTQTITQRTISAGSYFPLEDIFRKLMFRSTPKDSRWRPWVTFLAGNIAGALNGLLMNPISSIKVRKFWNLLRLITISLDCIPNYIIIIFIYF